MLLVNCELSLTFTWSKNCILTGMAARAAQGNNTEIAARTGTTYKVIDTKLHVLVVTLSAENDNKLLEDLKKGFKETIKRNKYSSKMSNQTTNNNLNYLIDPIFTNVNRLFVLPFENETDGNSFSMYYILKIEIKDFNVLIDRKPFFGIPVKNQEDA